jgi:cytochrome c-type biogenesis protein CcmE
LWTSRAQFPKADFIRGQDLKSFDLCASEIIELGKNMSPQHRQYLRFGVAISVMILGVVYLGFTGAKESEAYYVTIQELRAQAAQGDRIYSKRLRVAGDVVAGSIKRRSGRVEFVLRESSHTLPVVYQGTEAPPDTFKDNSQALATGTLGRDGVFHANALQAKCASKYAPAQSQDAAMAQPAAQSSTRFSPTR